MQPQAFDLVGIDEAEDPHARYLSAAALCAVIAIVIAGALCHLSAPSRWPATTGTVIGSHYSPFGPKQWGVFIYYEYEVDHRTFTSDNITTWQSPRPGRRDSTLAPWQARRLVEQHPAGSPMEIRYHPDRPEIAVVAWNLNHPPALMAFAFLIFCTSLCAGFITRACLVKAPSP